jgi:hypothetical protein
MARKCDVCGATKADQQITDNDREWYPWVRRGSHLAAWITRVCTGCMPGRAVEQNRTKPPAGATHPLPR